MTEVILQFHDKLLMELYRTSVFTVVSLTSVMKSCGILVMLPKLKQKKKKAHQTHSENRSQNIMLTVKSVKG